jgi:7-cyano-7-deazaguanine synthase
MTGMGEEAIVLVSGGMDSCVCCAWARRQGWALRLLHVGYGQRTEAREQRAFSDIAEHFGVPPSRRMTASIGYLATIGGSSLTDTSLPVEPADLHRAGVPTTYVPFRNAHLLSIAVSWAEALGVGHVVIGAVHDDSSGYPDCRPEYYAAFNELVRVGTAAGSMRVHTPLIAMSKDAIVRLGTELGAPLSLTWSCYRSADEACGECDSCALRLRAFARAGCADPIPYKVRPAYT